MNINQIKPGMMVDIDEICPRTLDRYDINPIMKEKFLGKKGLVKKVQPQDDKIGAVFIDEFVFASEDLDIDMKPIEKPKVKETKFDPSNLF
jgi:hypothetical protein